MLLEILSLFVDGASSCFLVFPPEIDNEGVIEPDSDDPQEMGDENVEVSTMFSMSLAVGKIGERFWV